MAAQSKLAGALSRNPKLERVSPGVYRNPKGDLVNPSGRVLPRPAPQPQQSNWQALVGNGQPVSPGQGQQNYPGAPQMSPDMMNALQDMLSRQAPSNVSYDQFGPVNPADQAWLQGGTQKGPRPAMQTPNDRFNWANQQQQDLLQRMIQQNPPVNYPGSNMQPPDMRLIQPIGSMPTGPLRPSYGNNGNSNNPGASAPAQRPQFRI
jgi:hypothetical protein